MRFSGKIALVTGGGRGIGASIVEKLLSEGASVHIFDKMYPDDDQGAARCFRHTGDVTDSVAVGAFIKTVHETGGRIDIVINNAGIIRDNVIWRMSEKDFDSVIEVNLKGPWLMSRAIAPIMRQQEYGRIVNISSRSWLGNFGQSNYSASKGGLISLTRVLALELSKYNVTVNAVAPGFIDTPLTRGLSPDVFQQLVDAQPGKKPGKVEDVAAAVAFLASDEAQFITGQVIHVDGGRSIGATAF